MSDVSPKTLCIYHGGCTDGVAAAWAVHAAHPEWHFWPGVHGQAIAADFLSNFEQLVFVDFAWKRKDIEMARRYIEKILVLDHHESAEKDLDQLLLFGVIDATFDMDRCGALIAWQHFHDDSQAPALMRYIDINDRGVMPESDKEATEKILLALRSYPHIHPIDWGEWDWLMANPLALEQQGEPIQRYFRRRVEELKLLSRRCALVGKEDMWAPLLVANAPYAFASAVAGELAKDSPSKVAMCWYEKPDGRVQVSIRSTPDGPNVAELAQQFGGGGHAHAAGFEVSASARRWVYV